MIKRIKMKAIVLAGGFARRLWPLTKDKPKPLLCVAGKPIIEYTLEQLGKVEEIDKIFISVNRKFEPCFREWSLGIHTGKDMEIVAEPTTCEEEKLGAIGALAFIMRERGIDDDLIVVAGDNIFSFDITKFLECSQGGCPVVALYDMQDKEMVKGKYGVVVLDGNNAIKELQEKPQEPVSAIVSTCCYFFPRNAVRMINDYLKEGNSPDAPGFFISWLAKQMTVQGFVFDGECKWFDIGSHESYAEANKAYGGKD